MPNEISSLEGAAYRSMADELIAAERYTINTVRSPVWDMGIGALNYVIPTTGAVRARSNQIWEPPVDSTEGLTLETLQQARRTLDRNMFESNYSSSTDIRIKGYKLTRGISADLISQNYIARVLYDKTILWEGSYLTKKEAQQNVELEYLKIYRSI